MKILISIVIGICTLVSFGVSKINQQWFQEYHYPSGNLKKVVNYKSDQYHGTSTLYYDAPGENIKMEVHFNEGEKTGFWTTRDEEGKVVELVDYSK